MTLYEGFFNFYWDEQNGKIYLEIDEMEQEFLYVHSLAAGVGSNDIGLDRGQLGGEHVVKFERVGPKVLLVEPNYRYRAITDNPNEREAVEQAFATSVHWGFKVAAEQDGKVLIDISDFLMRDAHGVAEQLKSRKQGTYRPDAMRSAFYLPATLNFPQNTEFEATLTFTGDAKGGWIRSVTPDAAAVTVRQHHSFVALPDDGYEPRVYDPRAGYYGITYADYATPIDQPLEKKFIARHRLQKKDPNAKVSEAVAPIIYYLDRGTPEPIRSALLEGAQWWNQAFEAIGYKDAFQVKMLPEGAHPLDVRYNVIQWVHRSTRGWSYGASVRDPRTGEIIKGHVSLGSLRVRQDFLIATGLIGPYRKNRGTEALKEMALARLRQLSAHEVGHTLGLLHNFAASTYGRASVMDYPHPLLEVKRNRINLENAYDTGIGEWDKVTIAYGYQDFPENTDEAAALNGIIEDYIKKGMLFISDYDARALGGAHPKAHLWDNGENAVEEMERLLSIRREALENFETDRIATGRPMALLEEALVPVYMLHRYQLEATAKLIGGLEYSYAVKGDRQLITKMLEPAQQRNALRALLFSITPEQLAFPEEVLNLIPPRPVGYPANRETFESKTRPAFDPITAAEGLADATLNLIFHPQRASRLILHHVRENDQPSLQEVIGETIDATVKMKPNGNEMLHELARVTGKSTISALLSLARSKHASEQAKATAHYRLVEIAEWLGQKAESENDFAWKAHYRYLYDMLQLYFSRPSEVETPEPIPNPDGSPIGSGPMCGWGKEAHF